MYAYLTCMSSCLLYPLGYIFRMYLDMVLTLLSTTCYARHNYKYKYMNVPLAICTNKFHYMIISKS